MPPLTLLAALVALALGGPLPTPKEIVARYDRALGGIEAIHRHTSSSTHALVERHTPDGVATTPIVVLMRAPYFQLTTASLPNGAGEDSSGFDGANNQFYDRRTGLLVGYEFDNTYHGAPALDHQIFSDYRKIDGVLMPMKETSKAQLKSGAREWIVVQVVTTVSVKFEAVDEGIFAPPKAVRDLTPSVHPDIMM